MLGDAVPGQTKLGVPGELQDVLFRHRDARCLPLFQDDVGLDRLAGPLIGHSNDGHLPHLGVPGQDRLDVGRIHVEPGHQDHVLLAIDDREVARLVHHGHVAREQPHSPVGVALQYGPRLVRAVPVAPHDLRAGNDHLAGLAGGHVPGPVVQLDDPAVGVGDRQPDRADLAPPHDRVGVRHGRGFRHAEALDQLAAGDALERLGDHRRERRRARDTGLDRSKIVLGRFGCLVDGDVQARHAREQRGSLFLHGLEHPPQVEARQEDHLSRQEDPEVHAHRQAV